MDSFKVESVRIKTTPEKAFRYISDPKNLPQWTHAFKGVLNGRAIMATPSTGEYPPARGNAESRRAPPSPPGICCPKLHDCSARSIEFKPDRSLRIKSE